MPLTETQATGFLIVRALKLRQLLKRLQAPGDPSGLLQYCRCLLLLLRRRGSTLESAGCS